MKSPTPSDFRGGTRRKGGSGGVLATDLVVYSHLRWDFVFQRPQQLMTRMARHRRVFFVEELPRNAMGKVQKNLLRQTFGDTFRG